MPIGNIRKIPYTFVGPYMDASVPSTTLTEGKLGRLVGVDGRFKGGLRKFYGMSEVKDLDEITGTVDTYSGPYYMQPVTFQKRGTSSVYRGFVVAWDEGNDTDNLAVDLFYTLNNGSSWSSHEIWAQSGSGITTTTEIDCVVAGAFLIVGVDGKATKTVYYKTSALTTVSSGPDIYSATLAALTESTQSTDSTYYLRGDGVYNVAWRFYDSTRGIYSAMSTSVTVIMDLLLQDKATGTISFDSGGGDSGLLIGGDTVTVDSRIYRVTDSSNCLVLNFEGSDGATTTTDESPYAATVTFSGDAQIDTAQYKFGSSSLLSDGTDDAITLADATKWDIVGSAADNWQVDFFVKHADHAGVETYIQQAEDHANGWWLGHSDGNGMKFLVRKDGSDIIDTGFGTEIADTDWHHVALCKVANEFGLYLDGTQTAYVQDGSTDTFSAVLQLMDGYNLFNTTDKLVLNLNGADAATTTSDESSYGHQVTFNDDAQLDTAQSKFSSASSCLFDGNTDSLTIPDSTCWDIFGSNADNWTISLFVKVDAGAGGTDAIIAQYEDADNRWYLTNSGVALRFIVETETVEEIDLNANDINDTSWHHIAICKVAQAWGLYLDGSQIAYDSSADADTFTGSLYIGADGGVNGSFDGHIDCVHIRNDNYFSAAPNNNGGSGDDTITPPTSEYTPSGGDYQGHMDAVRILHFNEFGAAPNNTPDDTITVPTVASPADTEVDVYDLTTVLQHTTALASAINGDSSAVVTASAGATSVTVTSKLRGSTGDGYALSVSEMGANTDDISVSGATLTGGAQDTTTPEPNCKCVLNFPADDAVISGSSTFAGFDALFDKVDVFRSIDLGDVVSTEGAILYLEQTLDMPADEAAWDTPLTVTLGEKVDESLPFQITYDPEKDVCLSPPQSGSIGRYEKITFMAEATGVDSLSKSDYDTVHSSLEHASPEYFTTYNRRKADAEEGRPLKFVNAGNSMLILEPNAVVHVFKSTDLKPLIYNKIHENRGLTAKYSAHAVGNSVFMMTDIGIVMVDATNGEMSQVTVADRVILGDWLSDLEDIKGAYDAKMNASFFLNPTRSEMIILWHGTKTMTMLEGANFVWCGSTADITASSRKKTRAYFSTDTGLIVTPDYDRSGTGTMWGLATGTTLNGTTTSASAGKNHCIDSGATFHADMVGCLLYWTGGDNAGEAVEISAMASGDLTTAAATNAVAVGDTYAISPVKFSVRCWPLQIPNVINPFLRKIIKGMEVDSKRHSGFSSNDNDFWRIGAYRNGGSTLETATAAPDVNENPPSSAGAFTLDGIHLEPYIEQISSGVDFELEKAEMSVSIEGDSREVVD